MDADVLRNSVHIPERAFDRRGSVQGRRTPCKINEVHRLGSARYCMPARQPYLGPLLNCGLARGEHVIPEQAGSVGQEEMCRAHECLCWGQASLCPTIVSNRLATPFVTLRSREVDEGFDRAPRDAERDGAKAGGDAGMRRE